MVMTRTSLIRATTLVAAVLVLTGCMVKETKPLPAFG